MGRGTVRGERRYGRRLNSASTRGREGDGVAGRGGSAAIDPLAESVDTVEGSIQHRRVDAKATALPDAADLPQSIHSRSVQLSSERLRVIAKMDLVEVEDGVVTPVD